MEGETVRCAANPQPATIHLPEEYKRAGCWTPESETPRTVARRLPEAGGDPAPSPGSTGNEWATRVLQQSPPPLPRPRSPRDAAVKGRGAGGPRSKQAPGCKPDPGRGRCPGRREGRGARPAQDPARAWRGGLAAARVGAATSCSWASAGGVRAPETLLRPYLLFHVPQQLFFDCVFCAAHGAAGGGQEAPSGPPSPCAPSPPPRLPTQRPTREAEPPPAALPACSRRSHCPVLSSAAIFRAPQTSGRRPGPFPQPAGRGCVRRDWGRGVRAGADALGRRARARAAGMVVMTTGPLPPRGREPAL